MRGLTERERWDTCVHEAGHAVAFALGAVKVQRVAVAPLGAESWRTASSNGRTCSDLWGLCVKSELVLPRQLLRWMMSEGGLHADARGYERVLGSPEGRAQVENLTPKQQREIRAQMVGLLAGPVAEQISRGETVDLSVCRELDDVAKAEALSWLLPSRGEFGHAFRLAEMALRRPEVWAQVVTLAEALERAGDVGEGIRDFLPGAEPDWPPPAIADALPGEPVGGAASLQP